MKKLITILSIVTLLAATTLATNTNTTDITYKQSASTNRAGLTDVTFGGGSIINPSTGKSSTSFDVSVSHNFFESRPEVWLGLSQSVSWEPKFAGETAIDAAWSFDLFDGKVSILPGWYAGVTYDSESSHCHSGPVLTGQYYMEENIYTYVSASYDLVSKKNSERTLGISVGIGWEF